MPNNLQDVTDKMDSMLKGDVQMDYKKILAATAVTSAAIVVPVVVQAAVENNNDLTTQDTYKYGEKIEAVKQLTISKDDGTTEVQNIVSYEWKIIFNDGTTKILAGTTNELVIPVEATDGAKIEVTAKVSDELSYKKELQISALSSQEITFKDLSLETPATVTEAKINTPISAIFNLQGETITKYDETITKYEWYIVENNKYHLLSSEKDMLIDVPLQASGKKLKLVATTEKVLETTKEVNYHTANLDIKQLELLAGEDEEFTEFLEITLKQNGKSIPTDPDLQSLVPGDVLSVAPFNIEGINGEVILPSQAKIQYQWFFTSEDGKTSSIITNATNATFTIPTDAFYRALQSYKVRIDIEVPNAGVQKIYFSQSVNLSAVLATDLVDEIDALFEDKQYKKDVFSDDFASFEDKLKNLKNSYELLSTNSKLLVTNYAKLQQAMTDMQLVKPLLAEIQKFEQNISSSDELTQATHATFVKQYDAIYNKYLKLDTLQRSLLNFAYSDSTYDAALFEQWNQYLKNMKFDSEDLNGYASTAKQVSDIIADISDLYKDVDALVKQYEPMEISDFRTTVNALNAKIKKIDKVYQPLQYTTLLKTALTDAKKAESTITKIKLIENSTGSKKTKAIEAAQKEYNKLNSLQKSLISSTYTEALNESATELQIKVSTLVTAIDKLRTENEYAQVDDFEAHVKQLLETYKTLSSTDKKLITNYSKLVQASKDSIAAKKFILATNKSEEALNKLLESTQEITDTVQLKIDRTTLTKYTAIYKAYLKLTPLQKSLVTNHTELEVDIETVIETFQNLTELLNLPSDTDLEVNEETGLANYVQANVDNVITLLTRLESTVMSSTSSSSVSEANTLINQIKADYKVLKPLEKKNVHNYPVLASASKIVKGAESVQMKLKVAVSANTESKLASAFAAYNKLIQVQKELIDNDDVVDIDEARDLLAQFQPDQSLLEERFGAFDSEITKEMIDGVTQVISGLSSKQLKVIPQYTKYQTALKDLKAVDSFVKKLDKLETNPTYSKKQSILTAFNKLTDAQIELFNGSTFYDTRRVLLDLWNKELVTNSNDLNVEIGDLFNASINVYVGSKFTTTGIDGFLELINGFEARYKKLDSKEKKLVTNYALLKTAVKDEKAVRAVLVLAEKNQTAPADQKEALDLQLQRAINKLTAQQLSLYKLVNNY